MASLSWISVGEPGSASLSTAGLAIDLGRDVEQVARVEADIERIGVVVDLEFLGGAAGIRVGDREHQLAARERELDGAAALARDRGDAVDRLLELLLVDLEHLVVAERNDAAVIRESAVDQLGGQHHVAEREADLALRQLDRDLAVAVFDQALHLADRLARHDDARHAVGARRQRQLDLRQAMAVGRDRAQHRRLGGRRRCADRCR